MVNYVNTVLVSNLNASAIATYAQATTDTGDIAAPSTHVGKFVIVNCDANAASLDVTAANAGNAQTIKVGIVTKKNNRIVLPSGVTEYRPIIKWSNEIKAADIKSYSILTASDWANKAKEDQVCIDFKDLDMNEIDQNQEGGKRFIVRLTFKDMPHRYRKWTESYEYITTSTDDAQSIAAGIKKLIEKEWKRARVAVKVGTASYGNDGKFTGFSEAANGKAINIIALPYDDDDSVDSLNWANKVRFNANIYWTNPNGDGWESLNKHFPAGVKISKTPGQQYPAEAKLVRDREAWAMGYQGILNRGEGTWPIIKPEMETQLGADYDAITLEFENMYRAADDIQRKTKQNLEIYCHNTNAIKAVLDAFVSGVQQDENVLPNPQVANATNP